MGDEREGEYHRCSGIRGVCGWSIRGADLFEFFELSTTCAVHCKADPTKRVASSNLQEEFVLALFGYFSLSLVLILQPPNFLLQFEGVLRLYEQQTRLLRDTTLKANTAQIAFFAGARKVAPCHRRLDLLVFF